MRKQPLKTEVGQKVRLILQEKGMTQQALADLTGMTKSYISEIISGRHNLTLDTIEKLEYALKTRLIPPLLVSK